MTSTEDGCNEDGMEDHVYAIPDKRRARGTKNQSSDSSTSHDQDGMQAPTESVADGVSKEPELMGVYDDPSVLDLVNPPSIL